MFLWVSLFTYYLCQGGNVFTEVCLFICLSVFLVWRLHFKSDLTNVWIQQFFKRLFCTTFQCPLFSDMRLSMDWSGQCMDGRPCNCRSALSECFSSLVYFGRHNAFNHTSRDCRHELTWWHLLFHTHNNPSSSIVNVFSGRENLCRHGRTDKLHTKEQCSDKD